MKLPVIKPLVVALAGNPNSGKTTIFNGLTGLRQKVANYPGVTVEKKVGKCTIQNDQVIDVIDLPGAYSLISRSPDELVAMQVLRGLRNDTPPPDVVICVIDASNLQRNLYLLSQLIELGRPLVVALNMADIAERRGLRVSAELLEKQLGVPVVSIVGHKKQGIDLLKQAIHRAAAAPMPDFPIDEAFKTELKTVGDELQLIFANQSGPHEPRAMFMAERLLIGDHASDVEEYLKDSRIKKLVDGAHDRLKQLGIDPMQADIEAHYHWINDVAAKSIDHDLGTGKQPVNAGADHGLEARATMQLDYAPAPTLTDRLDGIFLHKIFGLITFAAIMAALFISIFIIADPLMGATEDLVGWLGSLVTDFLPEEGAIRDLWTDGIVAGVGGVVVFVPQIAMLFLFLAILEDSGYLARAAFLMDRLLGKLGLNGKSFIPMLSSFACAIPGVMATRTIENRKDRLATIFVAPFMSCSARLPVYGLLIGAFFADLSAIAQGGIMFACYALGVIAAVVTAVIFKKSLLKGAPSSFVLELPSYKLPQISQIIRVMVTNTWAFVRRAGTIIFALSIILWAMAYYPRIGDAGKEIAQQRADEEIKTTFSGEYIKVTTNGLTSVPLEMGADEKEKILEKHIAAAQLEQSISGRLGHFIEPVIKPLGYDWKMGVGLIASFAAREVFVSQMGIVYSAGDTEEDPAPLEEAMKNDRYADGSPVWTSPVAISLLVWFVLAMQCMSTMAVVKRETGSWNWAIFQLVYMNGLAYVCAFFAYQISFRIYN